MDSPQGEDAYMKTSGVADALAKKGRKSIPFEEVLTFYTVPLFAVTVMEADQLEFYHWRLILSSTLSTSTAIFVNGKVCKDPKVVNADDFFKSGLNVARNTSNNVGFAVTVVNVFNLPGLNTLGISLARIDYAPYGLNPPHTP
ncbi:germin-like protein subfamily 1 member 7 [Solanum tuberosum]|uniref:germin-like protein subfamily 1 member 7 n=1 Tax=Solanum tuberosum TaxID=4113 RepID=UPI000739FF93|nr:PREDICTED: germin-like protein subfamily 1 member 7 [Solanum tuberosum]